LGTLNHTLLTLRAAEQAGIPVKGVILNRTEAGGKDAIESGYADIITEFSGVPVLGEIPFLGQISENSFTGKLLDELEASLDFRELMPKGNTG
jgi:dethiobiotin synthetase